MSRVASPTSISARDLPRWLICLAMLGVYISLRGYHSFDSDQCYRLPLLLHQQDPSVYADDPFVRAIDAFNPHRGSITALDLVTRPLGLSAGLLLIFILTFCATFQAIDRMARAIWPECGRSVGVVAIGLFLAAKAGNIGTNHLFEAMVLDRLMAFALGWLALAAMIVDPIRLRWRAVAAISAATLIHPSLGLQLAMVFSASWALWALVGRWTEVSASAALQVILGLALSVLPGLAVNVAHGSSLQGDIPADVFWLLSVELQSPQHMLPHLWRKPQWLAWASYLILAALALTASRHSSPDESRSGSLAIDLPDRWPAARCRLVAVLVVALVGLAVAWCAVEQFHSVTVTVFQPFRMATLVRGIALVVIAGRLMALWRRGVFLGRMRAVLIAVAFVGDWLLVVVSLAEVTVSVAETISVRSPWGRAARFVEPLAFAAMLALGLNFLGHHDTAYGNRTLLVALAAGLLPVLVVRGTKRTVRPAVIYAGFALAWILPLASLLAAGVPLDHPAARHPLVQALVSRCRFGMVPVDDIERLGLWCQDHTPTAARFIGPPGPKTFRLWSCRSLAFNRAASPYHAAGLTDWFARFQDHVDFHGSPAEFVRAYIENRHGFESRYQSRSATDLAGLALRQGATYVVTAAPQNQDDLATPLTRPSGPLELLHVEGRYAVYRLNAERLAQRQR